MASLELKPELVKPYLKLLVEALNNLSNNKGSLRKDIWDYLYNKYENGVDYRDFLLAIRKFRSDGKMENKEGIYSMAPEVVTEVREKTPTPVFSQKFTQDNKSKPNMFIQMMSS
jgi:hypothetical protein